MGHVVVAQQGSVAAVVDQMGEELAFEDLVLNLGDPCRQIVDLPHVVCVGVTNAFSGDAKVRTSGLNGLLNEQDECI